jgi:hypothetical protein
MGDGTQKSGKIPVDHTGVRDSPVISSNGGFREHGSTWSRPLKAEIWVLIGADAFKE